MGSNKRAIIIGAGIIGATSAYALARRGWSVTLLDERAGPALGTSYGNGRQLSYGYAEALANSALLTRLPGLALGRDEAFRLSLSADPHLLAWLARFLRNCTATRFERTNEALLALAERSRGEMERLLTAHELSFERRKAGKLMMFGDTESFARARQVMDSKVRQGLAMAALDRDEAIAIEPALAHGGDRLIGAIHVPGDETGNGHLLASELARLAQREYGARFRGSTAVRSIELMGTIAFVTTDAGEVEEAELAVVCAGHQCNALLKPLGFGLPVVPMKGYSFTAPKGEFAPAVSISDAKRRLVFTDIGERMLVAGIADLGNGDDDCSPARMKAMLAAAEKSLPGAARYGKARDFWTGHRPVTPDSLPVTRRLARALAVNGGHGMLGWTLAMGSAALLAEQVGAGN